jgi:hypothetical protein
MCEHDPSFLPTLTDKRVTMFRKEGHQLFQPRNDTQTQVQRSNTNNRRTSLYYYFHTAIHEHNCSTGVVDEDRYYLVLGVQLYCSTVHEMVYA